MARTPPAHGVGFGGLLGSNHGIVEGAVAAVVFGEMHGQCRNGGGQSVHMLGPGHDDARDGLGEVDVAEAVDVLHMGVEATAQLLDGAGHGDVLAIACDQERDVVGLGHGDDALQGRSVDGSGVHVRAACIIDGGAPLADEWAGDAQLLGDLVG